MDEIERLRKILSTYDPASELSKVNATRTPVKVSKELIDVLKLYDHWQSISGPAYSGRLGKIREMWKEAAATGKMPSKETVATAAAAIKIPLWRIDEKAGTVQRSAEDTINIDSLGKGFVISRAVEVAQAGEPAPRGLLLNIGGDITAVGSRSASKSEEWHIDIADPAKPAENAPPLTSIKLQGKSVATSGSYERGYQVGNVKLSHIIDPRNGYPVDSPDAPGIKRRVFVSSATVIAADNAAANALATTLCVLTPEAGLELIGAVPGTDALIVMSDGTRLRSPGFGRYEVLSESVAGKGWENGTELSLSLQYATIAGERPYIAIWVEDTKGAHVVTLAEWGSDERYITELTGWMRFVRQNNRLFKSVSRATRPAGKYTIVWDGRDQNGIPVPAGTYKITVEFSFEHYGHTISSATIECGDSPATVKLAGTRHCEAVDVVFGPKNKPENGASK
jgi:thiamine biosynthesis lipoprotein ApbE